MGSPFLVAVVRWSSAGWPFGWSAGCPSGAAGAHQIESGQIGIFMMS